MLFSSVLAFVSLLGVANGATYTVTVGITETNGNQGLGFDPSAIFPQAGDILSFTFQPPDYIKNPTLVQHTATQSTFENPCTPKAGGFDSGLQTTSVTGPTFTLAISDTQPLWFYSYANRDCNAGMVLAVNPLTSGLQTLAAFQDAAKTAVINTPSNSSSSSSLPSSTPSPSSGTNTGSGTSTATGSGSSKISTAEGVGLNVVLALGAIAFAAVGL